jgi:hypothetical protein
LLSFRTGTSAQPSIAGSAGSSALSAPRDARHEPPTVRGRLLGSQLALYAGLSALVLIALGLRVYGIAFGLPHLYYWDEPAVVNRAIRFGSGDLNPHFFFYPSLYLYVLFGVSGIYFVTQLLTGNLSGVEDFGVQYFVDPTGIYLAARLTTVLLGTACVLAMFFVGRRYFNTRVGLLGALFLAVSVNHATQSHVAVTDVPHAFFLLLALLAIHRIMEKRGARRRDYAIAGLLIGLGAATKYFAILLVPSLLAAHFVSGAVPFGFAQRWPRLVGCWFSPKLAIAGVATFLGFFAGSPYNILDFSTFIAHYQDQIQFSGAGNGGTMMWFIMEVFPASLGWPLYLAALAGLITLIIRRDPVHLPWIIFGATYFIFTTRASVVFARYMIPVEILLCLSAAFFLVYISDLTLKRVRPSHATYIRAAMLAFIALMVAWPGVATIRWDAAMAHQTDPRSAAVEWMEQHVAAGSIIAVQSLYDRTFLNAPVMTDLKIAKVARDIPQGRRFEAVRNRVIDELHRGVVYREVSFAYDFDALERAGVGYILVSNQNWPQVDRGVGPPDSPEMTFKQALSTRATLVGCFVPAGRFAGDSGPDAETVYPIVRPTIRIYRVDASFDDGALRQAVSCGESD